MEHEAADWREDMREIKADLQSLLVMVSRLPTRTDLLNYLVAGLAVVIAACGIFVAGLGWLETRAARVQPAVASAPQPIVITLPAAPSVRPDSSSRPRAQR